MMIMDFYGYIKGAFIEVGEIKDNIRRSSQG